MAKIVSFLVSKRHFYYENNIKNVTNTQLRKILNIKSMLRTYE